MSVIQIVCVDDDFGIGKAGELPWQNKEEMRLFRTLTTGHVIVMGRKTWQSLREVELDDGKTSKMLKGRTNVVVSRSLEPQTGVSVCRSVESALEPSEPYPSDQIFIIGGAELYRSTLAHTDLVYVSSLPENYGCDTFYPKDALKGFERMGTVSYETFKLRIYRRNR